MGMFSRLRASSSTKPKDASRPQTPSLPPSASTSSAHVAASTPLSPVRSNIVPSSSSDTVTSSRFKWRKGRAESIKGKDFALGGPAYDEILAPPQLPGATPDLPSPRSLSGSFRQMQTDATSTNSPEPDNGIAVGEGTGRIASGEWRKEGGILGKLNFESPPIATSPQEILSSPISARGHGSTSYPASIESGVIVDPKDAVPPNLSQGTIASTSERPPLMEDSDAMEQLETPEKKKFWKARTRRESKAASVKDLDERSFTPTPRKNNVPLTTVEATPTRRAVVGPEPQLEHPRPAMAHRPSSSFFKNPFPRSASRASAVYDLDNPPPTSEGSFELKGWRHVSGTSNSMDTDGGYFSATRNSSYTDPTSSLPPDSGGIRPVLSRPPSVAGSLKSFDEPHVSASRVSVAAFRKGIRRPSIDPTLLTSDEGHGKDDDDDLPLGMMRRPQPRNDSSSSLSKLRQSIADPSTVAPTSPAAPSTSSPPKSPAIVQDGVFMNSPPTRPSNSAFVVRSARSSRHIEDPPAITQPRTLCASSISQEKPTFADPLPTRTTTPAGELQTMFEPLTIPSDPMLISPTSISPALELFESLSTQRLSPTLPAPLPSQDRPTRTPPPVQPVHLPTPRIAPATLSEEDIPALPLPPDEMPPSPLPGQEIAGSPHSTGGKRNSILQEPLRVLSGIWGSPSSVDGFDAGLVLSGMQAFGGDEDRPSSPSPVRPPPLKKLESDDISTKETLFDASAVPSVAASQGPSADPSSVTSPSITAQESLEELAQSRLDLQARLAAAAGPSPKRPSLSNLNTNTIASRGSKDDIKPPASAKTESSVQSSFSRAPPSRLKGRVPSNLALRAHAKKGGGWSSSESDDEDLPRPRGTRRSSAVSASSFVKPKAAFQKKVIESTSGTETSQGISGTSAVPSSDEEEEAPLSTAKSNVAGASNTATPPIGSHSSFTNLRKSSIAPPLPRSSSANSVRFSIDATAPTKRAPSGPSNLSARPPHASQPASTSGLAAVHAGHYDSPASSQSGLTGESSSANLVTPHGSISSQSQDASEGNQTAKGETVVAKRPGGHANNDSISSMDQLESRQRRFSQPQIHSSWAMPQGGVPAIQMPPMPGMPMDPASYQSVLPPRVKTLLKRSIYMKQQFQAQWMAAAYRASEEEWERASVVSGTATQGGDGMSSHHSFPAMPPMPHFQMPYGFPGWTPQYAPMAMPYPAYPQTFSPSSFGWPPQAGGGLYSYAPGAQSVYGGEFGPPSQPLPAHERPVLDQNGRSTSAKFTPEKRDSAAWDRDRSSARPSTLRPSVPSSASQPHLPPNSRAPNRNSGSPPSSWRKSGTWVPPPITSTVEEPSTPKKPKVRPQLAK